MPKAVTIHLDDNKYELFRKIAAMKNWAVSGFIENAVMRYIEDMVYADDIEMAEINSDKALLKSLERARSDVKENRRRRVA